MKTFSAKAEDVQRHWWVIDAQDQILGRVATRAAKILRGKHKAIFTPHVDTGDFVVVINAKGVRLSGNKEERKRYTRYTGYVGGLRSNSPKEIRSRFPERLVEHAVRGMIPHNRLGRQIFKKLKVYPGADHPHAAQGPQPLEV
ncbi:MAG TPA: 50S ribosomal protein L13 [Verrucomicrobiales bacterium]|nr:50S ribosomal protein L13 [Verrucomicrobiales bacterium]